MSLGLTEVLTCLESTRVPEHLPPPEWADDVLIDSVTILGADELTERSPVGATDLVLVAGASPESIGCWLTALSLRSRAPAGLVIKPASVTAALRDQCEARRVLLIVIDARARWEIVFSQLQNRLERESGRAEASSASATDLFDLAEVIAEGTGGLVTIEDAEHQRVLAYSSSGKGADELRTRAILGREAPPDSMAWLRETGVMSSLRVPDQVIDVPAADPLGMKRRLVAGIHSPTGMLLGSIWVQEGAEEFPSGAEEVVLGAAASAAGMLQRSTVVHTTEGRMIRGLFSAHSEVGSEIAAGYFAIPVESDLALIGIASADDDALGAVFSLLELHVRAYAAGAVTALLDSRAYVLLPAPGPSGVITDWLEQMLVRLESRPALDGGRLHAALAAPVPGISRVRAARHEVDRVLDAVDDTSRRVSTLSESRTSVLLRETLDLIAAHAQLRDPRLDLLAAHDRDHGSAFVDSLRAFLVAGGGLREAARSLSVHPNSLRYRLGRAQKLTGLDLSDPRDRLLTEIQLAIRAG
ncbi:PucR-like helix-turn-helix protein [Brevibacterium sanguinis]|uniref:PucR-like helix-turn-helix protein n=2 Tax=Brevibacterium TaxID=1696 RepID=A0A366IQX1_9MICO|nr:MULTISPECIES: helix-turn-helix domain-containing protein [Brevibacterium]RBP68066.1 PucR-like helix-turn-helix protein [Brevibacterium sanguinis]RBP74517.1 PucR-like helix-turn-helix protein [Brevibacterium celere]